MTKQELQTFVQAHIQKTHDALQLVYDSLNKGQKNKLLKNDEIVSLFERYGVGGDA